MNTQTLAPCRTQVLVPTQIFQRPFSVPVRSGVRSAKQTFDGRKEVFFELDDSSAREVLLVGDFTGWEKAPVRLRKTERGSWRTALMLAPARYHYKFIVDGQWRDDPCADARCPNPFGTSDSLLEIS